MVHVGQQTRGRVRELETMPNKIFGIGLSKTGTTSLTDALRLLGYRAVHYPFGILGYRHGGLTLKPERLSRYQACTDSPIARFFPELDRYYPGSKFILTTRRLDRWLDSCERHHVWPGTYMEHLLLRKSPLIRSVVCLHRDLYGSPRFDRKTFSDAYRVHEKAVLEYFRDRPGDLLVLDICSGQGWEKLCPFLGHDVPGCVFPKKNVGAEKIFKRNYRKYFWKCLSLLSP